MALLLDPATTRAAPRAHAGPPHWIVPAAALVAVAARLPFLGAPPGADEAGFLQVAAQWSPGGGSLYGSYWVDRPPLLITLFRLAAESGGLVPLRLLGCLASVSVVLLVAWTARQVSGERAGRWAAVAAAALTASPLVGALEVNGELLAAPFVALGLGAGVAAVRSSRGGWAALAGASGVAALMVKQNFADVGVFGAALLVGCVLSRTVPRRTAARLFAAAVGGGALALVVLGVWTRAHGTSVVGVFDAIYPFRLQAAQVLADGGSQYAALRIGGISWAYLASGLALLTVCLVAAVVRTRLREPVLLALLVTVVFDLVSVAVGGGYWLHYLVQLVVPLSVGLGLAAGRAGRPSALVHGTALALTAVATVISLASLVAGPPESDAQDIGRAIASAAAPTDTLVTLYGEPQVNYAAGLPSPYEHLWSLPIKTLDPDLTQLQGVLDGPRAPTWLVTVRHVSSWGLSADAVERIVATRYHVVAVLHDQTVYRLDRAPGPTPSLTDQSQEPQ